MSKQVLATKPKAEVVITWPNKSESRFVRPAADESARSPRKRAAAPTDGEQGEDYRVVMECAPYTASFNHLLSERRPNENPHTFATLVYERMRSDAVPMNAETYNLLMSRLVCLTDGSIFDLYEQFKSEGTQESSSVQPNKETYVLLFRACERNAEYPRAFLLYQEMRELFHLTPDTATYNTLLGFCAAVKDVAQACYFMDEMAASGTPLDANTYNCYMSVLVDSAPYKETLEVFNRMCDEGASPTLRTYNTLLKAMRAHRDFDRGFQVYEEMKKKGCIPDTVTYNTLLWICEDRLDYVLGTGAYRNALRSHEQKVTGTTAVANLTLTLVVEMQAVGAQPNTFSYNKVLSVLLRCEDPRIFSVYQQVQRACAEPRSAGAGVQRTARKSLSGTSTPRQRLESPRSGTPHSQQSPQAPTQHHSGVSSTSSNSTAKPAARAKAGAKAANVREPSPRSPQTVPLEEVVKSLEDAMREEDPTQEGCICAVGVKANMETERLIMRAFLLFEQPEKCKKLHLANRKLFERFQINRELAVILLEVCEKTKDRAWAEALLQEVLALNRCLDAELFNAYLAVLSAVNDPALSEHFELMKLGIHKYGVAANTQTFNIVMRGHLRRKELGECLAVYSTMCGPCASRVGEVVPNDETLVIVIHTYGELQDADGATEVVERALARSIPMGTPVYQELLRLYVNTRDERVGVWFARMKGGDGREDSKGAFPPVDAESYAIMMQYYLAEKRYEQVAKLFSELKTSQVLEPNTAVYRVIFDLYKAQGNRKAMMAVFDDARMNSVKLDVGMYNAVLETFVEVKDPFVFEVLSEMRENCIPPEDSTMAIFLASAPGRQQLAEAMSHSLFYKPTGNGYF